MKLKLRQDILLFYLIKRSVIFLGVGTLLVFGFFIIGNVQNFLDRTQEFLLNLDRMLGLCTMVGTVYGAVLNIVMFSRHHTPRYLRYLLGYVLAGMGAGVLTVLVSFISVWLHD